MSSDLEPWLREAELRCTRMQRGEAEYMETIEAMKEDFPRALRELRQFTAIRRRAGDAEPHSSWARFRRAIDEAQSELGKDAGAIPVLRRSIELMGGGS